MDTFGTLPRFLFPVITPNGNYKPTLPVLTGTNLRDLIALLLRSPFARTTVPWIPLRPSLVSI